MHRSYQGGGQRQCLEAPGRDVKQDGCRTAGRTAVLGPQKPQTQNTGVFNPREVPSARAKNTVMTPPFWQRTRVGSCISVCGARTACRQAAAPDTVLKVHLAADPFADPTASPGRCRRRACWRRRRGCCRRCGAAPAARVAGPAPGPLRRAAAAAAGTAGGAPATLAAATGRPLHSGTPVVRTHTGSTARRSEGQSEGQPEGAGGSLLSVARQQDESTVCANKILIYI